MKVIYSTNQSVLQFLPKPMFDVEQAVSFTKIAPNTLTLFNLIFYYILSFLKGKVTFQYTNHFLLGDIITKSVFYLHRARV